MELNKTILRAKEIGFELNISDILKDHLVKVGYDPQYGARPLKRAIQKWIDDYVTEFIIENEPKMGSILNLNYDSEKDITEVSLVEEKKTKKKKE